jgi:hypothetical protein
MPKVFAVLVCFIWSCSLLAQNPTGTLAPPVNPVEDTSGQRDLIDVALKVTHIKLRKPPNVAGKKVYFSFIPLSTSVPGGGNALVTATTAGFYLGDRKTTYQSNITFSPSTNFKGEYNIPFRSNIWTPNNAWNFGGDTRLTVLPQYVWEQGGNSAPSDKILIHSTYVRFYENALKRIKPYLFVGLGYNLDWHIDIYNEGDTQSLSKFTGYPRGTEDHSNSFSSGLTFNLLYDTRNNSLNPLPGFFYNAIFRANTTFLGSQYNWYSLYLDARKYISFSERHQNVLALWSYFWTTMGTDPPYLDLPALGWDAYQRSGRGFYQSRYVGRSLLYGEAEYRRSISPNELLGIVLFVNMNTLTEPETSKFSYLHVGAGGGLRIKFNKHSGTNVCIDFGASKGYWAFYLNLGEAF